MGSGNEIKTPCCKPRLSCAVKPELLKSWSLEIDYSRAPCRGADQKTRGLWERDWTQSRTWLLRMYQPLISWQIVAKNVKRCGNWHTDCNPFHAKWRIGPPRRLLRRFQYCDSTEALWNRCSAPPPPNSEVWNHDLPLSILVLLATEPGGARTDIEHLKIRFHRAQLSSMLPWTISKI